MRGERRRRAPADNSQDLLKQLQGGGSSGRKPARRWRGCQRRLAQAVAGRRQVAHAIQPEKKRGFPLFLTATIALEAQFNSTARRGRAKFEPWSLNPRGASWISASARKTGKRSPQARLLADSTTLYLKTHNFHWNVKGPMFNTLHVMFMEQYTELWTPRPHCRAYPRPRFPCSGDLSGICPAHGDQESEVCTAQTEMIKQLVAGPGGRGQTAAAFSCGRQGWRRTDRRSSHPAHADPRKERLDAAQPPGKLGLPVHRAAKTRHWRVCPHAGWREIPIDGSDGNPCAFPRR